MNFKMWFFNVQDFDSFAKGSSQYSVIKCQYQLSRHLIEAFDWHLSWRIELKVSISQNPNQVVSWNEDLWKVFPHCDLKLSRRLVWVIWQPWWHSHQPGEYIQMQRNWNELIFTYIYIYYIYLYVYIIFIYISYVYIYIQSLLHIISTG